MAIRAIGIQSKAVPFLWLYLTGIAIGLAVMRDPWPARLLTAVVWPLGPAAFVLVVSLLLVVATILWPLVMFLAAAVVASVVWLAL